MYVGRDFDPSDEGENEVYSLDFVKDVASGETIVSAQWFLAVAEDSEAEDANAQDHIVLDSTNAGTVSSQRIAGLVRGVKYVVQAKALTSQGNTKSLWSHIPCGGPQ
jgi:hypothetical protein